MPKLKGYIQEISEHPPRKLGDVCHAETSAIALKDIVDKNGPYPIYGAAGFVKNVDFFKQELPYIAVVKDGAGIGRVLRLPAKSSVIGTMQYIIPNEGINLDFLFHLLVSKKLEKYFSGSTIPHIYFRDYKNEAVNVPAYGIQVAMAQTLDSITSLISLRRQQLEKLQQLAKSQFVEMFGTQQEPKYALSTITEVADEIFAGGDVPVDHTKEADELHSVPIFSNGIEHKGLYGFATTPRVTSPSITVSARGTIGCIFIRTKPFVPIIRLIVITPNLNRINLIYLAYALDGKFTSKTGSSIPQLPVPLVKTAKVILPSLKLQNQFASFIAHLDKSKFAIEESIRKLELLYRSKLQEYFG